MGRFVTVAYNSSVKHSIARIPDVRTPMSSTEVLRTGHGGIWKTPDVCGGDACIAGTRVPVWSLVVARRLGKSNAELRDYFVTPLSDAEVEAAFGYYAQNTEEIEREIRMNEEV